MTHGPRPVARKTSFATRGKSRALIVSAARQALHQGPHSPGHTWLQESGMYGVLNCGQIPHKSFKHERGEVLAGIALLAVSNLALAMTDEREFAVQYLSKAPRGRRGKGNEANEPPDYCQGPEITSPTNQHA